MLKGASGPAIREMPAYAPDSTDAASEAALGYLVRACYRSSGFQFTMSDRSRNLGPYQFPESDVP